VKRLLISLAIVSWLSLITATPALSETRSGLNIEVYTFDPNTLPDHELNEKLIPCVSESVPTSVSEINFDVGGDIVAGCRGDFVAIHYSGYLTFQVTGSITLQSFADDGFYLTLDGEPVIDDWTLKGCSGSSAQRDFIAGVSQRLDAWWYEYGGGACNILYAYGEGFGGVIGSDSYSSDPVDPPIVDPDPVVPDPEPTTPPVIVPPIIPDPPVVDPDPVDPDPVDPDPVTPPIVDPPVIPDPPIDPPVITPVDPDPVDPPVIIPVDPDPPITVPTSDPKDPKPQEDPITAVTSADPATLDPQSLTDQELVALFEIANTTLLTADPESEEYQNALEQLFVVAQADDMEVPAEIAGVPLIGNVSVAVIGALNYLGNVGSDMSPQTRAKAKKEVIAAVVVTQIATGAAALATQASVGGAGSVRRKL